jgi:hypothetical protein
MALDFQQVQAQVRQLGEQAPGRERRLKALREQARGLLESNATELERLQQKVQQVVQQYDSSLRCALPSQEPLTDRFPLPALPERVTVLAADGSQIIPDRHVQVEYGLINVGAIRMCYGSPAPPEVSVYSRLFYDEQLYTASGTLTGATLALRRDLNERTLLANLAAQAQPPAITFTDGLMEIWGGWEMNAEEASEFQKSVAEYLAVLNRMHALGVTTAGYVDKPATSLVVRLLEVAQAAEPDLPEIRQLHPLRGVYDVDLYEPFLGPGERSPVFAVQSPSSRVYTGPLALHFFYLNVGRPEHPWLARVEIPAWVAENRQRLDPLHAVLVHQCRMLGARAYPYLLHRAHETAVVSLEEKEQVTQMIALELRRRGVVAGEPSQKQAAKGMVGRTSYRG